MNTKRSADLDKIYPKTKKGKKYFCRFCGKELSGKKTSWCSQKCTDEALIRCWPTYARHMVFKRDKGICAVCGVNVEKLRESTRRMFGYLRKEQGLGIATKYLNEFYKKGWYKINRSWWEAHHIIPVSQGGGLCGLENYQTLCVLCHKKETSKLKKT